MATAKATLSNFRQAPRKMRVVANLVRGKNVNEALTNLDFVAKKASQPIKTLLISALANAKAQDIATENLIIKTIKVDGGAIMYRRQPVSRGSAHPIRKRTSSIFVELGEKEAKKDKKAKSETGKAEPKAEGQEASASTVKKGKATTKKKSSKK